MSTDPTSPDLLIVIVVSSFLIAIFGTAANTLSLTYFVHTIRSSRATRNHDASTTKIFAALNIFDLLVCIASALKALILYLYYNFVLFQVSTVTLAISVQMTSFLTCLLAVVRSIQVIFPLNRIYWRVVTVFLTVYSVVVVVLPVLKSSLSSDITLVIACHRIQFFMAASIFLTVVIVNIVCLVKLYSLQSSHTETRDIKRKASITVAIISLIYCVSNVGAVVFYGATLLGYESLIPQALKRIAYFILFPLNSASNPLVYLIRKKEMRIHIKKLFWCKIEQFLCRREDEGAGSELDDRIHSRTTDVTKLDTRREITL